MSIETMKQVLEVLNNNRRKHYSCEDSWYSCPKDKDGCANDQAGDDCTCGADKSNVEIDSAIAALQEAIAEAEKQEPDELTIAYMTGFFNGKKKREWVGLTDEEKHDCYLRIDVWSRCVEMVENKLRKKNGC